MKALKVYCTDEIQRIKRSERDDFFTGMLFGGSLALVYLSIVSIFIWCLPQ